MARDPKTAELSNPTTNGALITTEKSSFLDSNIAALAMIGAAIRNENLAASSLLKPLIRAPVIAIPERDTPGIIASP